MKRFMILAFLLVFYSIAGCARVEEKLPDPVESLLAIAGDASISDANRIVALSRLADLGDRRCAPRLCQLLPNTEGIALPIAVLGVIIQLPSRSCLPHLRDYWQQLRSVGVPPDKLGTALFVAIEKCEKSKD